MARTKGTAIFAVNFEPTGQSPLDARLHVNTLAELYTAYPDNNYYPEMVVTVASEQAQYMLIDVDNRDSAAGWKRIDAGGAEAIEVINNLTSTSTTAALAAAQGKALKDSIDALDSLTMVKLATPEGDNASSYQLQKNGAAVGATINIPKDLVVSSGSVETVTVADDPYTGAVVGDIYIKLVLNGGDELYIPANKLVDEYTGSTYITVGADRSISVNYTAIKAQLTTDLGIEDINSSISDLDSDLATLEESVNGITTRVTTAETNITNLQTAVSAIQAELNDETEGSLASEVAAIKVTVGDATSGLVKDVADLESSVSAIKVKDVDSTVSNGVNLTLDESTGKVGVSVAPATLAGAMNSTQIKVGQAITGGAEVAADSSVAAALQALSDSVQTAVSGGITSITSPDSSITVTGTGVSRGISVAVSQIVSGTSIVANADGKIDLAWIEA